MVRSTADKDEEEAITEHILLKLIIHNAEGLNGQKLVAEMTKGGFWPS